jgi:hypothetical protein
MPDREQLFQALRNADAAGDVEGAKKLASYIGTLGPAPAAPTSPIDQIPLASGAAERMRAEAAAKPPEQHDNWLGRIAGVAETGLSVGSSLVGGLAGSVVGAGKTLLGGHFGTQQGIQEGDELAGKVADAITYKPSTQTGQALTAKLGEAMTDSGIIGVPIPELEALSRSLPIGRAAGRAPIRAPIGDAAPAANLEAPTYFRKGGAPLDLPLVKDMPPAAPVYTPSQLAQEAETLRAQNVSGAVTPSQLAAEMDRMKARGAAPVAPRPAPTIAAPIAVEPPPMAAPLADAAPMASPGGKITAGLRDTSDIDGILQEFGVAAPAAAEPMPSPLRAADPVRAAPEVVADQPFVPTLERHADPAMRDQHLQTLRDVGLENIRESAITGDAAAAAREFQHGKFTSEPAGLHWNDQFNGETAAMKNYAERLADDTGGRRGLDSESLEHKGREIAAPYDAMRKYFEDAKTELYAVADREAAGKPLTSTDNIDGLLADRGFNNTALADKQLDLVKAVQNQFEMHKERNAGLMTAKEAEDFRKWLNQRWTPDNSKVIGAIKDALDKDVFAAAGDDVYAAARRLHQEEMRVMDDPHGISKLMDSDPRAPINRATPYEAIPNSLLKLSNEQFKHIIDTYKGLPPELQPLAQQAIATLKAHYAERLLNAGTETAQGNPRQLWNAGGVNKFAADNSGKLPMVFSPEEMARIGTMLKAGEILRVNPAHPGAAAQLANASKGGLMTHVLGRAGGGIGALVGGMAGPAGAAGGAFAGEAAASALLKRSGERAALERAKAAIVNEHRQAPKRSPIDEWEHGLR